jgi:hypothetical protein
MAAVASPSAGDVAVLAEGGRGGVFIWMTGDQSANVTADPQQGIYVAPSTATTGASGAWVRQWNGIEGRPEWFYTSGNWDTALAACRDLCPITVLGQRDYIISNTLLWNKDFRSIRGVRREIGKYAVSTSRIVLDAASANATSADIILVGFSSARSGGSEAGDGTGWLSGAVLQDFTVVRAATNPVSNANRDLVPCGVRLKFVNHGKIDGVCSVDSIVGFWIGATVYTKLEDCYTRCYKTLANGFYDNSCGYFIDGQTASPYSGSNASLYMKKCLAVHGKSFSAANLAPVGIMSTNGVVDLFIDEFEAAETSVGLYFSGVNGGPTSNKNVDCHIRGLVVDGCGVRGAQITNIGQRGSVILEDCYMHADPNSNDILRISDCFGGGIRIIGGEIKNDGGTMGEACVVLDNAQSVSIQGLNIVNQAQGRAVWVKNSGRSKISVNLQQNTANGGLPAIHITDSVLIQAGFETLYGGGNYFACAFRVSYGGSNPTNAAICDISLSGIDPGYFSGGGQARLQFGATGSEANISQGAGVTSGTFGDKCRWQGPPAS